MKNNNVTVECPNGLSIHGPQEEVVKTLTALGHPLTMVFPEDKFYNSSSIGYVRIKDMQTDHLKNVVLKKANDYLKDVKANAKCPSDFVSKLIYWSNVSKHVALNAMLEELNGRSK